MFSLRRACRANWGNNSADPDNRNNHIGKHYIHHAYRVKHACARRRNFYTTQFFSRNGYYKDSVSIDSISVI
jgi:hypothetical protein